jgi:hypothetical protein
MALPFYSSFLLLLLNLLLLAPTKAPFRLLIHPDDELRHDSRKKCLKPFAQIVFIPTPASPSRR